MNICNYYYQDILSRVNTSSFVVEQSSQAKVKNMSPFKPPGTAPFRKHLKCMLLLQVLQFIPASLRIFTDSLQYGQLSLTVFSIY